MSSLEQCTPMSGVVVQHVPTSTSVLEVGDFSDATDYHEYDDPEQMYNVGDPQVDKIFEDDGSEDGEEIEEYLEDEADDGNCVSSLSDDEENTDTIESFEVHDIVMNEDICESKNVDQSDGVPQSSHCDREASSYTSESSSGYCYFNNAMIISA